MNSRHAVALAAAIALALTLAIVVTGWDPAYRNRALHATEETVAALVLLLVAALLAGRVARNGSLLDLLALAGVLVLATKNLFFSVFSGALSDSWGGLANWRTTGAGMVGAALLVAAACVSPRHVVHDKRKAIVLTTAGSLAAFLLLSAIAGIFDFPGALTDPPDTEAEVRLLSHHSALVVADVAASACFLVAGVAFARRAEREADEFQTWLGIASTIAAFGYLNYALEPSSYTDVFHAGDLFRSAAVIAFGVGTMREYLRYQSVYAPATVLDERRRMARDLHDGVAQELAFIASRMHRLDDERTVAEVNESVLRALGESRAAISTLSRPLEEPLHVTLADTAKEAIELSGARLELDLDPDAVVPAVWAQALPRIVGEAVANAVRHGRPQTVTVQLSAVDGIRLRVTDDGAGFDPAQRRPRSGLIGMRERAEALGGEFRLASAPGRGTSVEVVLP